jgi:glutamyl-tRNA synthetase
MVFRSEDTDKARSSRAYEEEIISGLQWLGLTWSNETIVRQSERAPVYRRYLELMLTSGSAYISLEPSKLDENQQVEVVRLKNPNRTIAFHDMVRGDITFDTTELGDIVIARNLDDALYHFTVVVDDLEMGVTHVLRGEDHISNTPRQILIQEAIGAPRPHYAHLPLILAPDRSKMSKRHGAIALHAYRDAGYTKEAIINYLGLLGWNPGTGQELFTLAELIEQFDVSNIQKSGAVFDIQKFNWYNKQYLDGFDTNTFYSYLTPAVPSRLTTLAQYSEDRLLKLLPTIRERITNRGEFTAAAEAGEYDFAFTTPEYETSLLQWKNDPTVNVAYKRLAHVITILRDSNMDTVESIKGALMPYAEVEGKGEVLWPLRVALSGKAQSPDPFTIAWILGKSETLARISAACDKIGE